MRLSVSKESYRTPKWLVHLVPGPVRLSLINLETSSRQHPCREAASDTEVLSIECLDKKGRVRTFFSGNTMTSQAADNFVRKSETGRRYVSNFQENSQPTVVT